MQYQGMLVKFSCRPGSSSHTSRFTLHVPPGPTRRSAPTVVPRSPFRIPRSQEPPMRIDLNSDLGESFGAYHLGDDAAIIPLVSSANIACGFHAGDPQVMDETVRLCAAAGVRVGAHPAHPDLQGFGRRELA